MDLDPPRQSFVITLVWIQPNVHVPSIEGTQTQGKSSVLIACPQDLERLRVTLFLAFLLTTAAASLGWAAQPVSRSLLDGHGLAPATRYAVVDGPCSWGRIFGGAGDDYDAWVIRLDRHGTPLWERRFGGPATGQVFSITPNRDDGGFRHLEQIRV